MASVSNAGPSAGMSADGAKVNMAFVAAIVAVATIGGFMFGYDSGVINGTQNGLKAAFGLTEAGEGLNVAAILLGCAFGAFAAGRLADVWGRRTVMIISALLFLVSALGTGAAHTSLVFVVFRLIGGLGVGAASVLCPVYISEVTPANIRGRMSSVQQIMIITGLTGAFLANYFLAHTAGSSTAPFWLGLPAWRWMFWMQTIPAGIFFLCLLSIPESPRYLVTKGKDAEAEKILSRLFGAGQGAAKVAEIRASLAADHQPKLSDLLDPVTKKLRPILWAGLVLAVFQQLVGINIVFYYGSVLWQSVGFTENDSLKINILSGSLSILACLLAIGLIDKIGRKPLLLIGSAGMAVTLGVLTWCFSTATTVNGSLHMADNVGLTALIAANAYVVFFNLSWGPVMWVMLGEMFPNQMRGSALAVAGFAQWIANFAISFSFPIMKKISLPATYGFYALCALVSYFLVQKLIQETRGKELEAMEG
ncbi:sugar porter family MFS transporter [Caulobacter sp. UNC358MFTsu5.1]|uniref:sugar porter family MFS transporter n=1 Tax=Caulobacter sp. UNC358MFTsu5.1 TaxID=1449049 RepID=UPI00054E1780|nr:sugar porter family MFS transporter [Caulobacter sp. UNC358MFTsu5.1]